MKFTDGYWLLRDGVKASFAKTLVDTTIGKDTVGIKVATRPINHRGDTLYGPVLSVDFTAPSEGIIGVKITNFAGKKEHGPNFDLFPEGCKPTPAVSHQDTPTQLSFTSGPLTVHISKSTTSYNIDFSPTDTPSKILTSSGWKSQAVFDIPYKWTLGTASNTSCLTTDRSSNPNPGREPDFVKYVVSELTLAAGELVYGLGERFGPLIKNGQVVSVWNADGGTSSEQAYKNIPFYLTNRGYGVFFNHPGEVELEVGSEKVSRVCASVAGESLEYFLIYGPTPKEILRRYTLMTGRPSLPAPWTFGLWLSTSFLTEYDEKTVSGFLEGMQQRECHVRVFHLDCFWMKRYQWCDFTFDPDYFPDPAAYLRQIKTKFNVKICVWINPYVSQLSPLFKEGLEGGYFIKRTNGDLWQWDQWQPGLTIVDFTNPAARKWYADKLRTLVDLGVDAFKTDFAERIPHVGVQFHDGSDPYRMHNMYTFIYNKLVYEVLQEKLGKDQAVLFARSATAGGQRFPVHWGGDCESTFEAMGESLRGLLSLTTSGFGFASHDIGGFEGHPPAPIYMRWVGYGLFSSHSRLHGSSSYRVPWNYGEEASRVLGRFVQAKHRLMPYIYAAAIEANQNGTPVQRSTFIEFPEDKTTYYLDLQYMFGPALLVAPVFGTDTEEVEWYIPAGRWTSFWSPSDVITGPTWVKRKVPYDEVPVFVRPGSIICLGKEGLKQPDYEYAKGVEVRVYELEEGGVAEAVVPSGKGTERVARVRAERKDGEVVVDLVEGNLEEAWSARWIANGRTAAVADGSDKVDVVVNVTAGGKQAVLKV